MTLGINYDIFVNYLGYPNTLQKYGLPCLKIGLCLKKAFFKHACVEKCRNVFNRV